MTASSSNSDEFTTIDGPHGPFDIAIKDRGRDEDGFTYVYRDPRHKFAFVAEVDETGVVAVFRARQGNAVVRLSEVEEDIIKCNIEHFFKTRRFFSPTRRLDPDAWAPSFIFNWEVTR
jgi:hypothetical protein